MEREYLIETGTFDCREKLSCQPGSSAWRADAF